MYSERFLKRKIYVALPELGKPGAKRKASDGQPRVPKICIEPDCSLEFTIESSPHETAMPQIWRDFFHVEVYRHLPMESLFKQKVRGYVQYAATGQHQALFHTAALSIAVICATRQIATILKRWTEDALHEMPQHGQRFFFRMLDTASAKPQDMFLSPEWQQAFATATTPLLLLEEGHGQ
jgi:hypothetical protein